MFQSLDWVDVDFDSERGNQRTTILCFNPSTGLMLISTVIDAITDPPVFVFQSLDWVDVDFDWRR